MDEDETSTTLASARKRGRTTYTLGEDLEEQEDSTTLASGIPDTSLPAPSSKKGRFGAAIDAPTSRIAR